MSAIGLLLMLSQPTVIELRQYTLHPGQRDVLIALFEQEFIESQEALGLKVLGTFRDLDNPDRFVWLRGFDDMPARAQGLEAFYFGPVWKAHREAANATMIDSDNVLLLHVAREGSGFTPDERPRPPKGATEVPRGLIVANIYYFDAAVNPAFVDRFERVVEPELKKAGMTVRASYISETSANNFPRLPVREKDHVFVWFAMFPDQAAYERSLRKVEGSAVWRSLPKPEVLRLQPTRRSAMHN